MIAIFLGGAHGKASQNPNQKQNQSRVRVAHTKIKTKKICVGDRPHSAFIYEAALDFCFWVPLIHHRVAETGQG
jgi:hypothetical protein